jgi:hypothetical protein
VSAKPDELEALLLVLPQQETQEQLVWDGPDEDGDLIVSLHIGNQTAHGFGPTRELALHMLGDSLFGLFSDACAECKDRADISHPALLAAFAEKDKIIGELKKTVERRLQAINQLQAEQSEAVEASRWQGSRWSWNVSKRGWTKQRRWTATTPISTDTTTAAAAST